MAISSTGDIKLIGYDIQHTLSGRCDGYITSVDVSGTTSVTPPYSVVWSGISSYTADTFDIINLCEGEYQATITDSIGNTGSTTMQISGFTVPILTGSLTNNDCVLDTNKLGTISVTTSKTETSSFRYELIKDGKLINTHYGTTADTTHTFTDIENGMYTVSVIEDRPLSTNIKQDNTGCTSYNYNDGNGGLSTAGWDVATLFAGWQVYAPYSRYEIRFPNTYGPNASGTYTNMYFDSGLGIDGKIYSSDPYVWFYTGSTVNRKTDTSNDWYLGTSSIDIMEGGNLGPSGPTAAAADVGYFYYNTTIDKFLIWWYGMASGYEWLTWDPRLDYGLYGNPVASSGVTGTTYGISNTNVTTADYTVSSAGTVGQANTIVDLGGTNQKLQTNANNNIASGRLSVCSYFNYTLETTFRSSAGDNDNLAVTLASFRDDKGKYGPSGATHSLDLIFNQTDGSVRVGNNTFLEAYAFNKYTTSIFRDCNGGCSTANLNFGQSNVLRNTGTASPFASGYNWSAMGATRVKISRFGSFGEFFNIQLTDTMGATASGPITKGNTDANPYNTNFTIDLNLLDKSTWVGRGASGTSASVWVDNYGLCKFLGSRRIGVWSSSQDDCMWYHIQFTGSTLNQYLEGPRCGKEDGASTTIEITATTGTTANTIKNKCKRHYRSSQKNVPHVRPIVNATLQNMVYPSLTINGLSKPTTTIKTQRGEIPALDVYNLDTYKGKDVQFYFGGNNKDMIFENMYPKFRIYPYVFQTEEVASIPDYEAIFDTTPSYLDRNLKSIIYSANTFIPLSALSTDTAWEFIIRPSYLVKDKSSISDLWVDTEIYPTSSTIDYNKDFYMVVVQNPPIPQVYLTDFDIPVLEPTRLVTETTTIQKGSGAIPDSSASTFSSATMVYTLQSPVTGKPLVTVNGIFLKEGKSGLTTNDDYAYISGRGDYLFNASTRSVTFNPETVQVGDMLQFIYDARGGSYTQFVTMPDTVSTSTSSSVYSENGYYYINLDKQSVGTVSLAINGIGQSNNVGYRKVSDKKIQLLDATSSYKSGDTFALFYKTIYQVVSTPIIKQPEIPVSYTKNNNLIEEIIIKLFDSTGNKVQELIEKIDIDVVGSITREFILLPPAPDSYYYYILIKRHYPLIGGGTIITESQTETINFEITRDVFYSPVTSPRTNNNNMGNITPY